MQSDLYNLRNNHWLVLISHDKKTCKLISLHRWCRIMVSWKIKGTSKLLLRKLALIWPYCLHLCQEILKWFLNLFDTHWNWNKKTHGYMMNMAKIYLSQVRWGGLLIHCSGGWMTIAVVCLCLANRIIGICAAIISIILKYDLYMNAWYTRMNFIRIGWCYLFCVISTKMVAQLKV